MSRCLLCACCLFGVSAAIAQSTDPEWPCIQVLVPEISAGILWPVPLDAPARRSWKDRPRVAQLARELGDAERYDDELEAQLDAFIASEPDAERAQTLNLLAAGTLAVANGRRSQYIDGIKRYTRQQIAIAMQIETALNRLASHDQAQSQSTSVTDGEGDEIDLDDPAQRAEFEETLRWHQRVYDQREQAIVRLCERPVELEQTLSDILRDMAAKLP